MIMIQSAQVKLVQCTKILAAKQILLLTAPKKPGFLSKFCCAVPKWKNKMKEESHS